MLGKFTYYNPTRIYFGENSLEYLRTELDKYGKKILLTYGFSSIKKIGLYDEVVAILKEADKEIVELPGVMPNPTAAKLYEGAKLAKEHEVDLILAVGGGSTIDYAKAVAASAYCEEDPWDKYFWRMEEVDNKVIPVASVLTMVGTGSEMNSGAVITNEEKKLKIGRALGEKLLPVFSILDPKYTFSLPSYQMLAGIFDVMSHILEQYMSGEDDNTSDYIAEGLMNSLVYSSRIAAKNHQDYEARSNIMWTASLALNTLIQKGKAGDWSVHGIGHAISACTDATHGMTLAAVSIPYYKMIMPYGLYKFRRFATNVWKVSEEGRSDKEIALEGISRMEAWMREIGLVLNATELGVTKDNLDDILAGAFTSDTGYKSLSKDEVKEIIISSMNYR